MTRALAAAVAAAMLAGCSTAPSKIAAQSVSSLPAKKGPRRMEAGPFVGYIVRRARKAGRCDYWRGALGRCANRIEVGDEYVEGELSDGFKAGGFGRDRYCMACARGENEVAS